MANPEFSGGRGRVEPNNSSDEKPLSLQEQLEKVERLLEENDENENIFERILRREQLQDEQDTILLDIENSNKRPS